MQDGPCMLIFIHVPGQMLPRGKMPKAGHTNTHSRAYFVFGNLNNCVWEESTKFWQYNIFTGRRLRGKAFYNVNGKVYCEEDFLVSKTSGIFSLLLEFCFGVKMLFSSMLFSALSCPCLCRSVERQKSRVWGGGLLTLWDFYFVLCQSVLSPWPKPFIQTQWTWLLLSAGNLSQCKAILNLKIV